jgi:Tfp pilus assembly protein PilO
VSRRLTWLLVVLGVVVLAGAGYLGLVSPRRAAAARAATDAADARQQLETNRILAARLAAAEKVRAADLFRLERAIPDRLAVQDVLLQLTQLAQDSGISITSVTPGPPVAGVGFQKTPIDVAFGGTYATASRFIGACAGSSPSATGASTPRARSSPSTTSTSWRRCPGCPRSRRR